MDGKVAIAIDKRDWGRIESYIDKITGSCQQAPFMTEKTTPDNTYLCIYWDWLVWNKTLWPSVDEYLLKMLKNIRHSVICIFENDDIYVDVLTEDERGCDEVFEDILFWSGEISFYDTEDVLAEEGSCPLLSRERILDLFVSYVSRDAEATELSYIYDALSFAGADDDEIRKLGFGYVIPEKEE